jgi:signal peptidase II
MSSTRSQHLTRIALLGAIVLMLVGCDQATKVYAVRNLKPLQHEPPQSYLNDMVRIHYVENPGAFLGMGGRLPPQVKFWVLTIPTALILACVTVVVFTSKSIDLWTFVALGMIVAGGIGNSIDRFRLGGRVIDFLNVGVGDKVWQRTGIFNVADVAITAGFIMLLPYVLKGDPKPGPPSPPASSS